MIADETVFRKKINFSNWVAAEPESFNRGLLFGDGLFETMIFDQGKIRFSDFHKARLLDGCKILGLEVTGLSTIEKLERYLRLNFGVEIPKRIRWTIFRKGEGKYTPLTDEIHEVLQIQPFTPAPSFKNSAFFHPEIYLSHSPWSHCKTINALPYVLANRDRAQLGMDEVLLLSQGSYLSEGGSSNLFWVKAGEFFTPSLATGCIAGVGRSVIKAYLLKQGITLHEGFYRLEDLYQADTVFTSNVTGVSYLRMIEGKKLGQERLRMIEQLFELSGC